MIRKPCFTYTDNPRKDMGIHECLESPLATPDPAGCCFLDDGENWHGCPFGRANSKYPDWILRHGYRPVHLCPECGIIRTIDEDSCCAMCGADSKEVGVEVNDAR